MNTDSVTAANGRVLGEAEIKAIEQLRGLSDDALLKALGELVKEVRDRQPREPHLPDVTPVELQDSDGSPIADIISHDVHVFYESFFLQEMRCRARERGEIAPSETDDAPIILTPSDSV
jgi:hypothetical protein